MRKWDFTHEAGSLSVTKFQNILYFFHNILHYWWNFLKKNNKQTKQKNITKQNKTKQKTTLYSFWQIYHFWLKKNLNIWSLCVTNWSYLIKNFKRMGSLGNSVRAKFSGSLWVKNGVKNEVLRALHECNSAPFQVWALLHSYPNMAVTPHISLIGYQIAWVNLNPQCVYIHTSTKEISYLA